MKGILLSIFTILLLANIPSHAKNEITIGILKFQSASRVSDAHTLMVEQYIYTKMTNTNRFQIIERARMDAIESERFVQELQNVEDKTAVNDLGADYVVIGEVTQSGTERQRVSGGGHYYSANISYGLRVLDIQTGSVAYSEQFSTGRNGFFNNLFSGFKGDNNTPEGAIDIAIRQTEKQVDEFITKAFPIVGQVIAIEKSGRRGKPETVLISLGLQDGMRKKTKLLAYITQHIKVDEEDLIHKKTIGELKFVRNEGDHISVFKISKGANNIQTLIESNKTIVVEESS